MAEDITGQHKVERPLPELPPKRTLNWPKDAYATVPTGVPHVSLVQVPKVEVPTRIMVDGIELVIIQPEESLMYFVCFAGVPMFAVSADEAPRLFKHAALRRPSIPR